MTVLSKIFPVIILLISVGCTSKKLSKFEKLNQNSAWNLQFSDPCTGNWEENWFLDGEIAKVAYNEYGMDLIAGPVNREDSNHAVLWTKKSFSGDVKIAYDYTRTDSAVVNVNILFIQATGIDEGIFSKDISKWNDYRKVPTMSKYYNNMKTIHISYAAFPMVNQDPKNDYLRVRRYPISKSVSFKDIEVQPSVFNTGLFLPGVTYKMIWIKSGGQLFLSVHGNSEVKNYSWDLSHFDRITEGRIGLRHMFTRSASYKNFKVWTK